MSGWFRLWIVLSVLLGIPGAFAGFVTGANSDVEYHIATKPEAAQLRVNEKVAEMKGECITRPEVSASWSSFDSSYTMYASCLSNNQLLLGILFGALPGALMAAVGLTARWVYRGFRASAQK